MKTEDGLYTLPTDERAREQGCYVDLELPEKIIKFCEQYCRLTSEDYSGAADRPLELLDWQKTLVRTLYGWKRSNGALRFNRCFCYVPRRQGKSVLVSALAVFTALIQKRAEIYVIASTQKQAGVVFNRACDFIASSPHLDKRLWRRKHIKTIEEYTKDKSQGSKICILSSEKHGKSGMAASLIIGDEFAEWPTHAARTVYDRLYDSGADRPNSLQVFITTPQFDLSHIGYEKFRDCEKILSGESDDIATLPVIYQAGEQWRENIEAAIKQACPSLNQTVPLHYYTEQWAAIEGKPLEETRFITMNLGRWVGSPTGWIPHNFWQGCSQAFNESSLFGKPAIIGLDYGASYDLTCICVVVEDGGKFYFMPRYYIPREIAQERQDADNVPYITWANDPKTNLYLTEGNVVDSAALIDRVKHEAATFQVREVRYDKTRLEGFRQLLEREGFNLIEVSQTALAMSPAFELFERLVRERKLVHSDNPISNWCLNNCVPKRDKHDRLQIEKSGAYNKIDFVDAASIALTHWLDADNTDPPEGQQWVAVW